MWDTDFRKLEGIPPDPLRRMEVIMDQQKKEINLTKKEIQEMIKDLEPGTMITVEMPIEITDTGKEPETD